MASPDSLNVIALISGGKDSFFSILHCLENGHKVIALANVYPPTLPKATKGHEGGATEEDLNSYMYQTVGHTVIPLYEQATGIPLYRQEISGTAVQTEKSYRPPLAHGEDVSRAKIDASSTKNVPLKCLSPSRSSITLTLSNPADNEDETESLVPLLRKVMAAHPEANAVSTGAILSTYQRTRIESVALRLGLVPLAYLWQYPSLHPSTQLSLLQDMEAVGLDARIIKVASGGLDESFLWENVASDRVMRRIERAMKRFGGGENGSVLGEGGEFETLVLNGPRNLFKRKIVVEDEDREVLSEGGGSAWLRIKRARVEERAEEESLLKAPRKPEGRYGVDEPFDDIIATISLDARSPSSDGTPESRGNKSEWDVSNQDSEEKLSSRLAPGIQTRQEYSDVMTWTAIRDTEKAVSVEVEMENIMVQIKDWFRTSGEGPHRPYTEHNIVFATILLRSMDTFASVNRIYGQLFQEPDPPTRVTVACGDMLPESRHVSITLNFNPQAPDHKKALHVQSRSYWAPANIGPYSQAISVPVSSKQSILHGPRLVYVAGQIPLDPATMSQSICEYIHEMPFRRQSVVALQHLWRIGKVMGVGWWTSAVAFLSSASKGHDPASHAILAGRVWEMRHICSEAKQEEVERDLWEEKHHGALGSGIDPVARPLPDYSMIEYTGTYVPPFFAAEVDGLPRDSSIEWHAHLGVTAGPIIIRSYIEPDVGSIHRCLIEGKTSITTILLTHGGPRFNFSGQVAILKGKCPLDRPYAASKRSSCTSYLDKGGLMKSEGQGQVVPCKSIWDKDGQRLAAAFVYRDDSQA